MSTFESQGRKIQVLLIRSLFCPRIAEDRACSHLRPPSQRRCLRSGSVLVKVPVPVLTWDCLFCGSAVPWVLGVSEGVADRQAGVLAGVRRSPTPLCCRWSHFFLSIRLSPHTFIIRGGRTHESAHFSF